jgi:predicted ribosome quality control (RQC) complex YloA/Tae2 family protein
MRISLDFTKTIEENAASYFNKSKKAKKKIEGATKALEISKKKLVKLEEKREKQIIEHKDLEEQQEKEIRKKEWYEKFRWFYSSEGFLVIGGRDATTNEIVIKKYTDKDDIVFHTDMAGSPFFVIKVKTDSKAAKAGKKPSKKVLLEVANATASYSRAWKAGLLSTQVFWVTPEQVSKEAKSGEYLAKGAFMIYGKTNYIENKLELAIGKIEKTGQIIAGPVNAIKKHAKDYVILIQGSDKASDIAKKVKKKFGGDLDEIIRFLPPGNCKIVDENRRRIKK